MQSHCLESQFVLNEGYLTPHDSTTLCLSDEHKSDFPQKGLLSFTHESSIDSPAFALPFERCSTSLKIKEAVTLVRVGSSEILPEDLHIDCKLGEGACGVVYKARCREKLCAIKVLKRGFAKGTPEYRSFVVEVGVLASLEPHPNLVGFIGAYVQDMASPVLVIDYVEGSDLESYLSSLRKNFNLGRGQV